MNDFFKQVEDHLKKKGRLIAVTQGKLKLQKKNTNFHKFNFNYDDVIKHASTVEDFIKNLPAFGFTDGAILSLRKIHGNSTQLLSEVELKFDNSNSKKEISNTNLRTNHPIQQESNVMENNPQPNPQQYQAPPMGMGFVDQSEYVSLKVIKERYSDLLDKLSECKKDRDDYRKELRISKDKNYELEKKLDTIEERHEIKIDRILADKKGFFETDTGKEAVSALAGSMPQIIAALKPQPAVAAMGSPLSNFSPAKQGFVRELKNVPDEALPLVGSVISHLLKTNDFSEQLEQLINNTTLQENG